MLPIKNSTGPARSTRAQTISQQSTIFCSPYTLVSGRPLSQKFLRTLISTKKCAPCSEIFYPLWASTTLFSLLLNFWQIVEEFANSRMWPGSGRSAPANHMSESSPILFVGDARSIRALQMFRLEFMKAGRFIKFAFNINAIVFKFTCAQGRPSRGWSAPVIQNRWGGFYGSRSFDSTLGHTLMRTSFCFFRPQRRSEYYKPYYSQPFDFHPPSHAKTPTL